MSRQITSDKNYMKRHPASGSDVMLGPNTSRFGGAWYTRDYVIPHNIGACPMIRVFYEPFRDGKLYEAVQDDQYYLSNPINTYGGTEDGPTLMAFVDETNLTLRMFFAFNTLAAISIPIYWVIYWDYGATT
jgi:hypothetical protein